MLDGASRLGPGAGFDGSRDSCPAFGKWDVSGCMAPNVCAGDAGALPPACVDETNIGAIGSVTTGASCVFIGSTTEPVDEMAKFKESAPVSSSQALAASAACSCADLKDVPPLGGAHAVTVTVMAGGHVNGHAEQYCLRASRKGARTAATLVDRGASTMRNVRNDSESAYMLTLLRSELNVHRPRNHIMRRVWLSSHGLLQDQKCTCQEGDNRTSQKANTSRNDEVGALTKDNPIVGGWRHDAAM